MGDLNTSIKDLKKMALTLRAGKVPNETVTLTNRVALSPGDHNALGNPRHVSIAPSSNQTMVFTVEPCESMAAGQVGFSAPLSVAPFNSKDFIASMTVIVDFQNKKKTTKDPFQTEEMMKEFLMQFASQVFSVGQPIIFQFKSMPLLLITIKELEIADLSALQSGKASKGKAAEIGISLPDTAITFEKGEGSALFLAGSAKGKMVRQSIINPKWALGDWILNSTPSSEELLPPGFFLQKLWNNLVVNTLKAFYSLDLLERGKH